MKDMAEEKKSIKIHVCWALVSTTRTLYMLLYKLKHYGIRMNWQLYTEKRKSFPPREKKCP